MCSKNNLLCLHRTRTFFVFGLTGDKNAACDFSEHGKTLTYSSNKPLSEDCKTLFLDINEPYTRRMIQSAFAKRKNNFRVVLGPGQGMDAVPLPTGCVFQWAEYERIDWSAVLAGKHKASSYCVRKGLSRKAQLAHFTRLYVCKNSSSILKDALPQTIIIDTWPVWEDSCDTAKEGLADIVMGSGGGTTTVNQRHILDKCLHEAKHAMAHAEQEFENLQEEEPPIWILKPSTINKGAGIQIVHCYEQVVDICWSESDIREWVLQRYISPPLLLRKRKFHIRAYALAVSAIRVYLSSDCLALCSGTRYDANDTSNAFSHITNTAYQELDPNFKEESCIYQWNSERLAQVLVRDGTCVTVTEARERIQDVICQMQDITAEVFRAYKNEFGVFSPIEGCFEHYGLDFVVTNKWKVYLLEINPGPDFKQTGEGLSPVIEKFMLDTIDVALSNEGVPKRQCGSLKLVYEHQMRGGNSQSSDGGINMKLTA